MLTPNPAKNEWKVPCMTGQVGHGALNNILNRGCVDTSVYFFTFLYVDISAHPYFQFFFLELLKFAFSHSVCLNRFQEYPFILLKKMGTPAVKKPASVMRGELDVLHLMLRKQITMCESVVHNDTLLSSIVLILPLPN